MKTKPKKTNPNKSPLHPRNKHQGRYDLKKLVHKLPELSDFVKRNEYGNESIDFFNPLAVRMLNTALLKVHYGMEKWEIPSQFLCPPVPGRADYIHYAADLLAEINSGKVPQGKNIRCLDVGVGANCIYPIIGNAEYGWSFIGSDIDKIALQSAEEIIRSNLSLQGQLVLRHQSDSKNVLKGVLKNREKVDLVICNPPFHSSAKEAAAVANKKLNKLHKKAVKNPVLNFGGQQNELWCEGGEYGFIKKLIAESKSYANACLWFTSLVSKKNNLRHFYAALEEQKVTQFKTIEMGQGNKISRIIAWTYRSEEQTKEWISARWMQ